MMRTRAVRGLLATLPLATLPLAVAVLLATAPLSTALACSCSMASVTDSLGFADVAFIGTTTAVEMPPPGEMVSSADPVHYAFAVEQVFKGPEIDSEIVATTAMDGASCGTAFGMDERWLVFGNFGEDGITTGLCSGNVLLVDGDAEEAVLAELGAPIAEPEPAATEAEPTQAELPIALLAGGALAAAVVGISLWAFVLEPRRRVR